MSERPSMTDAERAKLKRSVLRMLGMLMIGIAYLAVVSTLGYALSIGLLLAGVMVYQGLAPSWRVALVATAGTLVLWVIFVLLLDIPLPAGIWARWV
jgi:cell division protein FtsW (lipid II flippase)